VERYHSVLRSLSSSPTARLAILGAASRFWARSAQWTLIVFDKLLQYRIVEPADVITFVFHPPTELDIVAQGSGDEASGSFSKTTEVSTDAGAVTHRLRDWSTFGWWDIVKLTVEKVNGRVDQLQARLAANERQDADAEERKGAAAVSGGRAPEGPEDNATSSNGNGVLVFPSSAAEVERSRREAAEKADRERAVKGATEEARKALEAIRVEQRKVLVGTTSGFVHLLRISESRLPAKEAASDDEDEVSLPETDEEWQAWWISKWYHEFVRLFSKHLNDNRVLIESNVFAGEAGGSKGVQRCKDLLGAVCEALNE